MSRIQQLHCTHCTFGTSALESREGAMLDKPLGYSVRAGSGNKDELRRYFRDVERFLYYYLQSDAPAEQKVQLDAKSAPKRLVFCPNLNGQQMLGQLSYRQYDTALRPGSYFGHILLSRLTGDNDPHRWSPLDALRSWQGNWVEEDDPNSPKTLGALETIGQVFPANGPLLTDDLLLGFLTTPAGQAFPDPAGIIPQRWREIPAAERADLLATTLQAYVALGSNRRDSVLLVIEHSLAALMFYGIARLLPAGPVLKDFGFSTFETNPDRLPVPLAALEFHDPKNNDLRPEVYRGRNFAKNTWTGRQSDDKRFTGHYGKLLVDTLIHKGWSAVEDLLVDFARTNPTNTTQLEPLAKAAVNAEELLIPSSAEVKLDDRDKNLLPFLNRRVCAMLAAAPLGESQLAALANSPKLMPLLNLIANDQLPANVTGTIEQMLAVAPPDKLPAIVASPQISNRFKEFAIISDMSQHAWRLPTNCPQLSQLPPVTVARGTSPAVAETPSLLGGILTRLEFNQIESLFAQLPDEGREAFAHAAVSALTKKHELWAILERATLQLDEPAFLTLVKSHARILKATHSPQISARVQHLLTHLSSPPKDFTTRITALKEGVVLCGDLAEAEIKLADWQRFSDRVRQLRPIGKPLDKHRQAEIIGDLALMLYRLEHYDGEVTAAQRVRNLQSLCDSILGSPLEIPDEVQRAVHKVFHTGTMLDYRPYGSRSSAHLAGLQKKTLIHVAIAASLVIGLVVIGGLLIPANQTEKGRDNNVAQAAIKAEPKIVKETAPKRSPEANPTSPTTNRPTTEKAIPKLDLSPEAAQRGMKKLQGELNLVSMPLSDLKTLINDVQQLSGKSKSYYNDYFRTKKYVRHDLAIQAKGINDLCTKYNDLNTQLANAVKRQAETLVKSPVLLDDEVLAATGGNKLHNMSTKELYEFLLRSLPGLFGFDLKECGAAGKALEEMRTDMLHLMADVSTLEESPPPPAKSNEAATYADNYKDISDSNRPTIVLCSWNVPPARVSLKFHPARYVDDAEKHRSHLDQLSRTPVLSDDADERLLLEFFVKTSSLIAFYESNRVFANDAITEMGDESKFPLRREILRFSDKLGDINLHFAQVRIAGKELVFEWEKDRVKNVAPGVIGVLQDGVVEVITSDSGPSRFICLSDQQVIEVEETHNGTLNHPVFKIEHRQFSERALNIRIARGQIKAVRWTDEKKPPISHNFALARSAIKGREERLDAIELAKDCEVEHVDVDDKNLGISLVRSITGDGSKVSIPVRIESPGEAYRLAERTKLAISTLGIREGELRAAKAMQAPEAIKNESIQVATDARNAATMEKKSAIEAENNLKTKLKEAKERIRGLNVTLYYEAGGQERPIRVEWCKIKSMPAGK